jgi:hypothetical protein
MFGIWTQFPIQIPSTKPSWSHPCNTPDQYGMVVSINFDNFPAYLLIFLNNCQVHLSSWHLVTGYKRYTTSHHHHHHQKKQTFLNYLRVNNIPTALTNKTQVWTTTKIPKVQISQPNCLNSWSNCLNQRDRAAIITSQEIEWSEILLSPALYARYRYTAQY